MSPLSTVDISASAALGGSISPSGTVTVTTGTNPVFTVTPLAGFTVNVVTVDGSPAVLTGGAYTFTNVQTNHSISVTFIADTFINILIDALVMDLAGISVANGYRTTPTSIKRYSPNPLQESRPALIARCSGWGPNEPMTGGVSWVTATIEVDCIVDFDSIGTAVDDPDRGLHRLMADVAQRVDKDWQLAATGIDDLSIFITSGYQPMKELASTAGIVGGTMTFQARYQWTSALA